MGMNDFFNKREFLRLLGSMTVAAPTAAVAAKTTVSSSSEKPSEPAYERVTRTNTLRCGYGFWEPGFSKDLKTGMLTGIFYDYLEAIGKHTGLQIKWTKEVGWGDYPSALNSGRIDAMCFGAWPKASLAREVLFTEPTYYLPINAYARADDHRFDGNPDLLNNPSVTLSAVDSELSAELAQRQFPNAKKCPFPSLVPQVNCSSMS